MFFDLHTHHPSLALETVEIESVYFGQEKQPLSSRLSVGLHPWHLSGFRNSFEDKWNAEYGGRSAKIPHSESRNGFDPAAAEHWLREQAAQPTVLAIGEAGLDKVTDTPWEMQVAAFQLCFHISEAFRKPLVLHCVRAFSEILALKKQWKPSQPWIFHGFEKNADTARMCLDAGCFLSFGAALFREKSHAAAALRQTPGDLFFLETDTSQISIETVYERAAEVRGMSLRDLQLQMAANFEALFA